MDRWGSLIVAKSVGYRGFPHIEFRNGYYFFGVIGRMINPDRAPTLEKDGVIVWLGLIG